MADRKVPKKDKKPDILFISGSPRNRSCVALIDFIERGAKNAGAKTQRFLLSKKHINPCIGCGGCNETGNCVYASKTQSGQFTDDYLELKAVLERVDALAIVAPLYFAGPPAQLKALYDRMQPYWAQRYLLGREVSEKRSAQLFVVGGGGDAHGHAPLVGSTKSALAVAGFNLEKVNNFIGFAAPRDVPGFPHENELEHYSHAQLAQLKRMVARQENFEQRAIDAGGAFARFVVKKKQAKDLAAQLAVVEAELEMLRKIGDAEKSEQAGAVSPLGARGGIAADRKGELQAEIDFEYSNLISRTPRNGGEKSGATHVTELLSDEFGQHEATADASTVASNVDSATADNTDNVATADNTANASADDADASGISRVADTVATSDTPRAVDAVADVDSVAAVADVGSPDAVDASGASTDVAAGDGGGDA
jgi:multimeric flavodoxin WrbA